MENLIVQKLLHLCPDEFPTSLVDWGFLHLLLVVAGINLAENHPITLNLPGDISMEN